MASFADITVRFGADLKRFRSQMNQVERDLRRTGKRLQSAGRELTTVLTLPLAGFAAASINIFQDFEQELAKVQAISGATASEFESLRQKALDLGATTRFTAREVATLELNLSKLGFRPEEITASAEGILQLAQATGEDLAQSATVAASTLRGFQLDVNQTGRVVDVMAASFSASALDLSKFETAMAILAPVANSAGISIERASAQTAILANAGLDASTAGTGLRNIYLDLAASGQTFSGAMDQINRSSNKNATALELFGKRGATVATVLAENIEQIDEFTAQFENAQGSAAKLAEIMDNTLQGSLKRLQSVLESVAIDFGEIIAPFVRRLADEIGAVVSRFRELSPETKKWIVVLGGVAAAIGPLLALAGTILPAIATGLTLLTGPIGLVVAGLTAVAAVIYTYWDEIVVEVNKVKGYFEDLYEESTAFRLSVEAISTTFRVLFEVSKFTLQQIGLIFSAIGENILTAFEGVGAVVKELLSDNGDIRKIPQLLAEAGAAFIQTNNGLFADVEQKATELGKKIESIYKDSLARAAGRVVIPEVSAEIELSPKIKPVTDGSGDPVTPGGAGSTLLGLSEIEIYDPQELDDFITELGGRVDQAIQKADAETFQEYIRSLVDSEGDLLETLGISEESVQAFENRAARIQETAEAVGSSVQQVFGSFGDAIVESLDLAANGFEGFVKTLAQTVTRLISMLLANAIANAIAGATQSALATGPGAIFTQPAFIATAVSGVVAAFASIPKFAQGGIVPGNSFSGDRVLAGVNSGELILNLAQQKNLAQALVSGNTIFLQPSVQLDNRNFKIALDQVENRNSRVS